MSDILNFSMMTLSNAYKKYPVFPKLKIKSLKNDYLEVVTYTISNNSFLVPIVMGKKIKDKVILMEQLIIFTEDIKNSVIRMKNSNFRGWNHFEGESNFVYPDGTIVHTRKIIL